MAKTQYGIQMYSLRDIMNDDFKGSIKLVSDMGYTDCEHFWWFDTKAEDVKAWMDEYGMKCSSTHMGVPFYQDDTIADTIRYHKTIGCDTVILPGCDWSTKALFDENIALIKKAQKTFAANGMVFGYHNHSGEFFETSYGETIIDTLLNDTDVMLEIDTFWAFNAGIDVLAFLEKHKDRIPVIHLKDGVPTAPENRNAAHWSDGVTGTALGEGNAPVKEIRAWALKNGVRMVVESEGLNPTGPKEVQRCMDFLNTLE